MTDILLEFDTQRLVTDFRLDCGDLAADRGLETAVLLSLFTDARARDDDPIPDGTEDKRGWWGSQFLSKEDDQLGSRLWLLGREKQINQVLLRAEDYAQEALQWLLDDGVASRVQVMASVVRDGVLGLEVIIYRRGQSEGPWQSFWEYQLNGSPSCEALGAAGQVVQVDPTAYLPFEFSPAGSQQPMGVQPYRLDEPYLPFGFSQSAHRDSPMALQNGRIDDVYRPLVFAPGGANDFVMALQTSRIDDPYVPIRILPDGNADNLMGLSPARIDDPYVPIRILPNGNTGEAMGLQGTGVAVCVPAVLSGPFGPGAAGATISSDGKTLIANTGVSATNFAAINTDKTSQPGTRSSVNIQHNSQSGNKYIVLISPPVGVSITDYVQSLANQLALEGGQYIQLMLVNNTYYVVMADGLSPISVLATGAAAGLEGDAWQIVYDQNSGTVSWWRGGQNIILDVDVKNGGSARNYYVAGPVEADGDTLTIDAASPVLLPGVSASPWGCGAGSGSGITRIDDPYPPLRFLPNANNGLQMGLQTGRLDNIYPSFDVFQPVVYAGNGDYIDQVGTADISSFEFSPALIGHGDYNDTIATADVAGSYAFFPAAVVNADYNQVINTSDQPETYAFYPAAVSNDEYNQFISTSDPLGRFTFSPAGINNAEYNQNITTADVVSSFEFSPASITNDDFLNQTETLDVNSPSFSPASIGNGDYNDA